MFVAKPAEPSAPTITVAMERYFEIALYLLVFVGFGCLASTGGLDLGPVLLVSAALLLRGYTLVTRQSILIPESWTTPLTVAYGLFYLVDYSLISRTFLGSTVHLVLFVMVVRLFSARRERDYYFLAVISFLMLLGASVLTVESTFLFASLAFMLVGVVTFILMEMLSASRRATIQASPTGDQCLGKRLGLWLVLSAPAFVVFLLMAGAVIFLVLPRLSSSYLSEYAAGTGIATGFSDHVQLGQIGEIQQSSSLVMHIQVEGDRQGILDLKWRGVTLNSFNGKSWSNPHEQHLVGRLGDRFVLSQTLDNPASPTPARMIRYRVLMEPVASSVFFLAPTPLTLEGNYRMISMDEGGAVFDPDLEHPVNTYEATSNVAAASPQQLRTAASEYPPTLKNDLQIPAGLDPRIRPLAEQITSSAGNNYDKAIALEQYLRTHFTYSLRLPRVVEPDPLANFLFERKQGHCEYFASALAIMLRTVAIPARVVNGFRTGEFNDITSQYLVRARNAHSWVEAFFPGYGWISFDPTPAAPAPSRTGWSRMMLYLDAAASFWREWVINYDAAHQHILTQQAAGNALDWLHHTHNWAWHGYQGLLDLARRSRETVSQAPLAWSVKAVCGVLLLILGGKVPRLWGAIGRQRVAARPEKFPQAAATIWYERTIRTLAKRGFPKSPAQTPEEFLRSIPDQALRERIFRLTQSYERARFGNSAEDAARLPQIFAEIRSTRRH